MKTNRAAAALAIIATTLIGGCASPYPPQDTVQPYQASSQSNYTSYGVIDSIQVTRADKNNQIGAGAVVGGVVGGLVGNQVGGGRGKTAATVAGVVGGALVGNQIEQNRKAQASDMYQINVRLENGSYATVVQDNVNDLRIGSRVRIQNDRVYRY